MIIIGFVISNHVVFLMKGTSNWSADYFTDTSGVSIVVNQTTTAMNTIKEQLKNIFERDWNSQYSKDISDL